MSLPDNLERLRQISIDTLGLSESTSALLKWYGLTHILDCMAMFWKIAQDREMGSPWHWLFPLLFGEVRLKLMAAGYWDVVLDADAQSIFDQEPRNTGARKIVHWQGQDQDLYQIPFETPGLAECAFHPSALFKSIGACVAYFLFLLCENPEHWLDIGTYQASDRRANEPLEFYAYLFGVVQPRLVELGYWRFVEEYIDDYIEQNRFPADFDWEDDEE